MFNRLNRISMWLCGPLLYYTFHSMLYHRLHPTYNKNTYLHDMFRFVFKSFSGAYHNKNFNNSVNAACCVLACVHIYGTFNFYIKNTLKSTLKN
jgi:hypothetical protein